MTNQIENAIIQLIKAHAVTPEIDYTELADRLHDKVCDNVDYDAIKDQVCDSIDIDAEDVARVLDASDIASNIPMDEVANEVCLSSLANHIDLSDLAGHLDEDQLQDNIKDAVISDLTEKLSTMEKRFAEKIAFMDERITGLEAKLAQPQNQPQSQPSTPFDMISRAKNLLADALGMLSNPTA